MISGNIQQLPAYLKSEIVQPIIDFLNKHSIQNLATGKHPVAANGIFAIVIKTNSRDLKGQQFEAHRQNLDIHYLVSGKEVLGFTNTHALQIANPYVKEEDYLLYHSPQQYSLIGLTEKQFVIFFPEDAHVALCGKGKVRKVVIKVPVEEC